MFDKFDRVNLLRVQMESGLPNWIVFLDLAGFVQKVLPYFFGVAGIVLIFMFITAGYKMMTSGGDPKAMQAAQAKLTTAAIGIVIILISFWLVQIIVDVLGINLSKPVI